MAKKIFGIGSIELKRETTREDKKIINNNMVCIKDSYYKYNTELLGQILGDKNDEKYNNKILSIDETFKNRYL